MLLSSLFSYQQELVNDYNCPAGELGTHDVTKIQIRNAAEEEKALKKAEIERGDKITSVLAHTTRGMKRNDEEETAENDEQEDEQEDDDVQNPQSFRLRKMLAAHNQESSSSSSSSSSLVKDIKSLDDLHKAGVFTDDQFENAKNNLLCKGNKQ